MQAASYTGGKWHQGKGAPLHDAVSGELLGEAGSDGLDFAAALEWGRASGAALRALSMHRRAMLLKALAAHLMEHKEQLYKISAHTGATRSDSWIDIEGGIGTLFSYSSIARREFADHGLVAEGPPERLSANGTFIGRHILAPRHGIAVHINAFNFPCWGMLEKFAPSFLAAMPVLVKPATATCYLASAMARLIMESGILPDGALQLVCGGLGNALDLMGEQDVATFTGSASTAAMLKVHPNIQARNIPFNCEADSLNCAILGASVAPDDEEFALFIKEVAREMTAKTGQKCTAIRRILVPEERLPEVADALRKRLGRVAVGNPASDGVRMGALAGLGQRDEVRQRVAELRQHCDLLCGGDAPDALIDADAERGAFFAPTLLQCADPQAQDAVHSIEAFGPVATLMPYKDTAQAAHLAGRGRGSLVSSVASNDRDEVRELVAGIAPWHGRILIINRASAGESTGHGSPLPQLVHGGPGRAGGGQELGGARAIAHYMQRTAVQGSPDMLSALLDEFHPGATPRPTAVHPFRLPFADLQVGDTLISHRRTVTEADIVNFGCLSGDHFYAHFDEVAAPDSLFGKRVAHGYFLISAAAGLFVDPPPGPVLANYGLENLRFLEPVAIGDTIRARLTAKRKTPKARRPDDTHTTGIVIWDVAITNQRDELVATYDVLTLVERKDD